MVVTIYKYVIENNLTKRRGKTKKKNTHKRTNGMYLSNLLTIYLLTYLLT